MRYSPAYADLTVDHAASWDGTTVLGSELGEVAAAASQDTYGQTFTTPAGHSYLVSFAIHLHDSPDFDPDPLDFIAYLMEWDGSRPTGTILFQGAPSDTSGLAHGEFREYVFDVGQALEATASYVFFVSAADLFDGTPSGAFIGAYTSDTYADGAAVQADSDGNMANLLTLTPWEVSASGWDLAFTAQFAPSNEFPWELFMPAIQGGARNRDEFPWILF